jgi:CRP/FNR family transcriptional regulator, polysaccharide utilization system transcription regulator
MHYLNPYIERCLERPDSVFKGLNIKDKETIALHHTVSHIRNGGFLFSEGEKSRGLIFLASGKAKVFKEGVGGRNQIIKMVRQDGFIGYRALFSENIWSFSASAIEDSFICILEKNTLIKLLKKNADLAIKFTRIMSEELNFSNNRTISLTQKHIRGRLAESLIVLRDTYGFEEDGKTLNVSLSREDIASLSNMTTSNAIRTLSGLSSDGIIGVRGRRITILDPVNLEHICNLG